MPNRIEGICKDNPLIHVSLLRMVPVKDILYFLAGPEILDRISLPIVQLLLRDCFRTAGGFQRVGHQESLVSS